MFSKPIKEHDWLQKMVGDWTFEAHCSMGPDKPASKSTGTEVVRSLGGLWVIGEGNGEMPEGGGHSTTIITLGYDTAKKRYVGTFVASMMTFMWHYEGSLDPAGKILTLETEGPDFAVEGKTAKYKDVVEMHSDDHRTLTSTVLGADGKWNQIVESHYRRVK